MDWNLEFISEKDFTEHVKATIENVISEGSNGVQVPHDTVLEELRNWQTRLKEQTVIFRWQWLFIILGLVHMGVFRRQHTL